VDFDEVRREIERETARICGPAQGVDSEPIHLRVHSPTVPTLTLVDLPGLTRVPVGDQPTDVASRIESMALKFVRDPQTLLLAVTSATDDLATSAALELARKVDPRGLRTLGVLTKCDRVDAGAGSAVTAALRNAVVPLRLGWVGVVCRGPRSEREGVTLLEQRGLEESFFGRHPAFQRLGRRAGCGFLAQRLAQTVLESARAQLPRIREDLQAELLVHERAAGMDRRGVRGGDYAEGEG